MAHLQPFQVATQTALAFLADCVRREAELYFLRRVSALLDRSSQRPGPLGVRIVIEIVELFDGFVAGKDDLWFCRARL